MHFLTLLLYHLKQQHLYYLRVLFYYLSRMCFIKQTFLFIEIINKAGNLRRGMAGIEPTRPGHAVQFIRLDPAFALPTASSSFIFWYFSGWYLIFIFLLDFSLTQQLNDLFLIVTIAGGVQTEYDLFLIGGLSFDQTNDFVELAK